MQDASDAHSQRNLSGHRSLGTWLKAEANDRLGGPPAPIRPLGSATPTIPARPGIDGRSIDHTPAAVPPEQIANGRRSGPRFVLRCSSAGWTQSAGQRAARLGGHDEGGGGAAVTTDQDDDAAASWVAHRTGAGTPTGCCWEERELGGYGVTQRCGAPVVTGRPWCARHLRRYLAGKKLAGADSPGWRA